MHGNSARNSTSWGNALLYPFFVKYVLEDEDGVSLQLRQSAVMALDAHFQMTPWSILLVEAMEDWWRLDD